MNGDDAEEPPAAPGDPNAAFNTTETNADDLRHQARATPAFPVRTSGRSVHRWTTARSTYKQYEQPGFFNSSRGVVPGDEPREISADVDGDSTTFGLYATDTWQIAPRTHLTAHRTLQPLPR